MTTSTLPRVAVDLEGNGFPWFPYAPTSGEGIRFSPVPQIPGPGFEWADLPGDDPRSRIPLDLSSVSQLLFASHVARIGDVIEFVCEQIDRQLRRCRCDLDILVDEVAQAYGDHPIESSYYMQTCLAVAASCLGLDT